MDQEAPGQGDLWLPGRKRLLFAPNTCGELMPIIPDVIRPQGDLRKRVSRPPGSMWNPVTAIYELQPGHHIGGIELQGRWKNQAGEFTEKDCGEEVKEFGWPIVAQVKLQELKERYEKAVPDCTECEDSYFDDFMTLTLYMDSRRVSKGQMCGTGKDGRCRPVKVVARKVKTGENESKMLDMSGRKGAGSHDNACCDGWETYSSGED